MEGRKEGQPTSRNGEESGPPGSQYAGTRTTSAARCQHSSRRGGIFRRLPPAAAFASRW